METDSTGTDSQKFWTVFIQTDSKQTEKVEIQARNPEDAFRKAHLEWGYLIDIDRILVSC